MYTKFFLGGLVLLLLSFNSFSQDPQFTQFYASPLYLSPSFSGSTKGKRISLNYRDQWPSLPKSFVTYAVSYDHFIHSINSGVGVQMLREQAGTGKLSTTNLGLMYAYHIQLDDNWRVLPGIGFYYTQQQLQFHRLTFGNELIDDNPTRTEPRPQEYAWDIDASASAIFLSDRYWLGLTADHLLRPNNALSGEEVFLPVKYSVFGGSRIPIGKKYKRRTFESIFPAFHFKQQGNNSQLSLGIYWNKQPFMIGFWYRGIPLFKEYSTSDAVSVLLGYSIDDFSIGYSYDVTISELSGLSHGAHEISFVFSFGEYLTPEEKGRIDPCPGGAAGL
ncbi:MAG: PorP/SprF family type IX secretion system membrane protein [Bacteroidales bacterium]